MGNVWLTSDLHLEHRLVARHRREAYIVDGFNDLSDDDVTRWHDALLAAIWDSTVKPGDVVWVLGDISAGGSTAQKNALEWMKARPGLKHLIAGNHDGCHPMHRDSHKWQRPYLEAFESVQMAAKRRVSLPTGHMNVMLSHFPYQGDRGPDRHREWRLRETPGVPVVHGHTHSTERVSRSSNLWVGAEQQHALHVHVGFDAWDGLVHWDEVCRIVQTLGAGHD